MKKIIILITAIFFSSFLYAQETAGFSLTYNHNALSVKDVNRSATFYMKVLQLKEITNRTKIDGIRWFSLGEGKELHLVSILKEAVTINKAVHFALNTNNMDALVKKLTANNIAYSDWPGKPNTVTIRADGIQQIYFQDPDGYWIEINDVSANTSVEQIKSEVWKLEENYWHYVKYNDTATYATLWDEQFIGYPSNNIIATKAGITNWITDMFKNKTGDFEYTLTRKVENVFGDIVIVLYDVAHNSMKDGAQKTNYKITHTWKKTDKGWLIIGGMGANK